MSDYPFGYGPFAADGSAEEAQARLEAILADKVLRFNPYRVGDEELVDCAGRGRWQPFPALTQMVIFHFLDIRTVRTGSRHLTPTMLAYKMFRLKGSVAEQADMIRQQMCRSKVAMLQEVMSYPTSPGYLGNGSASVDYATPIRAAIQTITQYHKPL